MSECVSEREGGTEREREKEIEPGCNILPFEYLISFEKKNYNFSYHIFLQSNREK